MIKHLISKLSQGITYVRNLLLHDLFQERCEFGQGCVVLVIEPGFDEDAVVWLKLEVFGNVVYDYCFGKVATNTAQIFNENWAVGKRMLSIKSVLYSLFLVDLIQNPVSIL